MVIAASYNGFALLEDADNSDSLEDLDGAATAPQASMTTMDKASLKHTLVALLRQKLPGFKEVGTVFFFPLIRGE